MDQKFCNRVMDLFWDEREESDLELERLIEAGPAGLNRKQQQQQKSLKPAKPLKKPGLMRSNVNTPSSYSNRVSMTQLIIPAIPHSLNNPESSQHIISS